MQKKVGNDRLIKACQRALVYGSCSYGIIDHILKTGFDNNNEADAEQLQMPFYDNIRGQEYSSHNAGNILTPSS